MNAIRCPRRLVLPASMVLAALMICSTASAAEFRPWLRFGMTSSSVDQSDAARAFSNVEETIPGDERFGDLDSWVGSLSISTGAALSPKLLVGIEYGTEMTVEERISGIDSSSGNDITVSSYLGFRATSYAAVLDWFPMGNQKSRFAFGLGGTIGILATKGSVGIDYALNGFSIGAGTEHEHKIGPLAGIHVISNTQLLAGFSVGTRIGFRFARANDITLDVAQDPADPVYVGSWDSDFSGWVGQLSLQYVASPRERGSS